MKAQPLEISFRGYTFALHMVPCDLCGGNEFHDFWDRMAHGLNLKTVFCKNCGLCQTNPRPTPEANNLFYSKLYNQFHKREVPLTLDGAYVAKSKRLATPRVETLSRFLDRSREFTVFEVGAGVGQFQVAAKNATAWKVSGVEPGDESMAICRRLDIDVQHAFFEAMPIPAASLDAVVAFHVFEHLESPSEFLRKANALLKPGGLLHLEVPNLSRPGGPSFSRFFQFPHLYTFSAATLRNYVSRVGGFKPLYMSEHRATLTVIAEKVSAPMDGYAKTEDLEQFNINEYMHRLKILERVYKLGRAIPPLPGLKKVRGTLFAV